MRIILFVIMLAIMSSCATLQRIEKAAPPCSRETPLGQSLCDG